MYCSPLTGIVDLVSTTNVCVITCSYHLQCRGTVILVNSGNGKSLGYGKPRNLVFFWP